MPKWSIFGPPKPERFLFIYQNKTYNQRNQQVIEYQTTHDGHQKD